MKYFLSFLIVSMILFSCHKQQKINIKKISLPSGGNELVEANNNFSFNVFPNIILGAEEGKNVIFSPLSLNVALLMAYNGANEATADSMKATMQLSGLSIEQINDCYKELLKNLVKNDKKVVFSIANSLWYNEIFPLHKDYISTLKNNYDAEVNSVDFSNPQTVNDINKWVKNKTNKKIDKIIDNLDPAEQVALLNALYFKGEWFDSFDKSDTKSDDFMLSDSSIIQVKTMMQESTIKTGYSEIYTAVELAYGQGNFVMDLFIPNDGFTISQLLDTLNNFDEIIADFTGQSIRLHLPKFEYEYKIKLNEILQNLGMAVAFSDNADFSKMSDESLCISRVLQKSYIKVDEDGTEAASVTFIGFEVSSAGPDSYLDIRFNKPFIYVIREVSTNTIIFMGKVANPNQ